MEFLKNIRGLRSYVRASIRQHRFDRLVQRLLSSRPDQVPDSVLVECLWSCWGNESYSGHPKYLEEVIRGVMNTNGPVLECGSGLTTLLLGLYAGRRGLPVWALEHSFEWLERIAGVLKKFGLKGVELVEAPLRSYGEFSWYDPPLDRMPQKFGMVICDGPPKSTPGDRYGLLPVMRDRLGSGSVILLDDVKIPQDAVLSRWMDEFRATSRIVPNGPLDSYAVIELE